MIGLRGGLNTYLYVHGIPNRLIDPLGLVSANPPICTGADCVEPPIDPTPRGPAPSPQPNPPGKTPGAPKTTPFNPAGCAESQPLFSLCIACCQGQSQRSIFGATVVSSVCREQCRHRPALSGFAPGGRDFVTNPTNLLPGAMKTFSRKRWITIAITHILFFAGGYVLSSTLNRIESGERALSNFMDGLFALSYLEKPDIEGARHMLRVAIDGNLLTAYRYGTPAFDAYTSSHNPNAKNSLLIQYDAIRKKYPPVEYSDGGAINRDVDRILNSARTSVNPGQVTK